MPSLLIVFTFTWSEFPAYSRFYFGCCINRTFVKSFMFKGGRYPPPVNKTAVHLCTDRTISLPSPFVLRYLLFPPAWVYAFRLASERSLINRASLLIVQSFQFLNIHVCHFGLRCSLEGSKGFPAIKEIFSKGFSLPRLIQALNTKFCL